MFLILREAKIRVIAKSDRSNPIIVIKSLFIL